MLVLKRTNLQVQVISVDKLVNCIKMLKSGKKENTGMLSDHLIHGSHRLYVLLTMLFNCMLIHGNSPDEMILGTMVPLQKDKRKSCNDSDNYRALTLGSCIGKLFDLIMINQQAHVFETSELQFAFKEGMSTTMCTHLANETISYYVNNNSIVYSLLLDASKAFDRVNYCLLFRKLIDRQMCPLALRLLLQMYTSQRLQVRWNDQISQTFNVSNGVRQGGVMSPLLFSIYVDGLLTELKASGYGCVVGTKYCGALGYADDIKLLVPTLLGLKKMITICENYAKRHDVLFNGAKSRLLIYNGTVDDLNIIVKVGNESVPVCDSAKHVGNTVCVSNRFQLVDDGIDRFNSSFNVFMSKFGSLASNVKNKLFNQFCCSFYGSQIWPLWHKCISALYVQWRNAMRKVWRVPRNTHCDLVPLIAGTVPLELSLVFRFIKFYKSLFLSENDTVNMVTRVAIETHRSVIGKNIRYIKYKFGLTENDMINESMMNIKTQCIKMWLNSINGNYLVNASVIYDCTQMRDGIISSILTNEEVEHMIEFMCTS